MIKVDRSTKILLALLAGAALLVYSLVVFDKFNYAATDYIKRDVDIKTIAGEIMHTDLVRKRVAYGDSADRSYQAYTYRVEGSLGVARVTITMLDNDLSSMEKDSINITAVK